MKLNKKEGIVFLEKSGLPTVKRISFESLSQDSKQLQEGLSVRLSPKKSSEINVNLPSIHNCKNYSEIKQFINEHEKKYDIIIHKTVSPEVIGSISKLGYRESIVLETYRNFQERKSEIINNRVVIPLLGGRMFISKMELLKKDEQDFNNFAKVIKILKDIPFEEYDMEYVIENGKVVFTDLTLPDNREYNTFRECLMEERE